MDYKEKYEEDLERAKDIYNDDPNSSTARAVCEQIFPELNESEDKKIRKFISHELVSLRATDEKGSDRYEELTNAISWLENQCEQKPTDKTEPKFKAGDWVVKGNVVAQILDSQQYAFVGLDTKGNDFVCKYSHADSMRLFTIQDAKDGDVLVTPNNNIFIFREIHDYRHIYDHCGLFFDHFIAESSCTNGTLSEELPNDYKPATKEQRDLLFSKMKEAGYEWDVEKRELRKIEQKSTDKVEPKFKVGDKINMINREEEDYTILTITSINKDEKCYICNQGSVIDFDEEGEWYKVEQKSAWSEEDESMYIRTLDILGKCYMGELPTKVEEELNWLKSLKERKL